MSYTVFANEYFSIESRNALSFIQRFNFVRFYKVMRRRKTVL